MRGSRINLTALLNLLEQQNHRCGLTGRELTPENCELDHIEPLMSGGEDDIDNIQLLCSVVNAAKGTMALGDFIQMCRDVVECLEQPSHEGLCQRESL